MSNDTSINNIAKAQTYQISWSKRWVLRLKFNKNTKARKLATNIKTFRY